MSAIKGSGELFVSWLVGDVGGPAPEVDVVSGGSAIAQALRTRLGRENDVVDEIFGRLAGGEVAESLIKHVLAECLASIQESLPELLLFSLKPLGDHDRLIYLVLSLAPNTVRSFSEDEIGYLATACVYDPLLLRHLLTWVSPQPSNTKDRAQSSSIAVSRWTQLARRYRKLFSKEEQILGCLDGRSFDWSSEVGNDLACRLIADVDLKDLIEVHWPNDFWTRFHLLVPLAELSPALARTAAENRLVIEDFLRIASGIKISFPDLSNPREPSTSIFVERVQLLAMSVIDCEALKVGWAAGHDLHVSGLPRTVHAVAQVLRKNPREVEGTRTCGIALLWADFQQLVEYQRGRWNNQNEIRGVLARLSSHLKSFPDAWMVSAREILIHANTLGSQIVDLLVLGAAWYVPLCETLEEIAGSDRDRAVCDRAQGLLARMAGSGTPNDDVRRWLVDSAARAFDGTPLFPNPLTSLAQTWLGSTDLDATLPTSIRQAMTRFSGFANDQGGVAVEEHITGVLLTELEVAFRGASLSLTAVGRSRLVRTISVSHRPSHKTTEEPRWGCDVALLLNADIRPNVRIELAELVQVKKSQAFAAKKSTALHEKWRIDIPQLVALLDRSQSAGYWLVLSTGEVVCLTARWIHALARGRDALGHRTVTIGYNEVRHAAVPMEQFLSELFIGMWIGSVDESTVAFARGDDANVRPRHIFEVSVIADQE